VGDDAAVQPGAMPKVEFIVDTTAVTTLRTELRVSSKPNNYTPDVTLAALDMPLAAMSGQKSP